MMQQLLCKIFVLCAVLLIAAEGRSSAKLPIEEIWPSEDSSDPNNHSAEFVRLDRVGPIYSAEGGRLAEVKLPAFPVEYTNLLLPFIEYGSHGLQMNLHYAGSIDPKGIIRSIGNDPINRAEPGTFAFSRRVVLIWKGGTIQKLNERFVCELKTCSAKQQGLIRRAVFPPVIPQ